ncbi:acetyltransferase [Cohnella pontilimi]|nr:acetyltransferase [Cohnella pontilimi]
MSGLLILGAGGHGRTVADAALMTGIWDRIAFLDDKEDLEEVSGFPVLGQFNLFPRFLNDFDGAFVAIGNNDLRLKLIIVLQHAGFNVPSIIHPHSSVSKRSKIAAGSIVMAGAVVNTDATIERGCIINTCSSVDHDCYVQEGVHISPGSHVGGTASIGRCSWLCMNSCIGNNRKVGKNVIVAAGSIVIKDVPDDVMVAGIPAIIKKRFGGDHIEHENISLSALYERI